ncbi:uncharacterized protein LOC116033049 [Ipomoea triloba]|uniref:uncharacterized protein LOC116033049 n=1 Tax=Ipomoea triloba TaxID=35885 RepID=UPI00125E3ADF|nr:uncharacterized protein LOC116033049 [Ipomoea triloba]
MPSPHHPCTVHSHHIACQQPPPRSKPPIATSSPLAARRSPIRKSSDLILDEMQKRNFALIEIERLLSNLGISLNDFPCMSLQDVQDVGLTTNRLLQEELAYDHEALMEENKILITQLADEQRKIYDDVLDDVENNAGGLYFVYGYGSTRKTFL